MNTELEKIAYLYGDVCVRKKKQRRKRHKILVIELLYEYAKNSTLHGLRYIVDNGLNILERLEKIAYLYGDVCVRKKKQRRKRHKILVIELLYEYAKNSTLHGLRYIVDNGLNILERLFWFITVVVSMLLCMFFIYNVVHKWRTSPVIVAVNERFSSVGSVPFPSVTICPQKKVNPLKYNYNEKMELYKYKPGPLGSRDYSKFQHIDAMCDNSVSPRRGQLQFTNSTMVKDIMQASPTIGDIFSECMWHGNKNSTNCEAFFSKVITEEGVCYTTNSLAASDIFENTVQPEYRYMESNATQMGWSLEDGYTTSSTLNYPKHGRVFGSAPDLSMLIKNDEATGDSTCNKAFTGYKIYLHHPAELPLSSVYFYAVLPNQLSSIAISFNEFNSDSSLIAYDAQIRQCYFPIERKLRYFKIYTASNCLAECVSNFTYEMCGCVGFYMPHHNSAEICHPHGNASQCMIHAKERMAMEGFEDGGCHCLPACNTVEYDADILTTDFKQFIGSHWLAYFGFRSQVISRSSKVDLFYKQPHFMTMQRRELFGFTELLGSIGGLLGLFLGFSFLSLIEIFYFLTVRVGFILKRDLNEEKAKEQSEKLTVISVIEQ